MSRHILDELVHAGTLLYLHQHHVPAVQVGEGWGQSGWQDEEQIIRHLHGSRCTFHTQDIGFFKRYLCHSSYCLVCYVDISPLDLSVWIIRFLRHPDFNTHRKRLGKVIKVTPQRIQFYVSGLEELQETSWEA